MRYHHDVDDEGVLERGIAGDEEELHRIELEQNLRDFSLPLSLSNPSQDSDQEQYDDHGFGSKRRNRSSNSTDSSLELEYPRHDPRPREVSIFHGHDSSIFDQSHMDNDYEDNLYSYRSREDEEGINPFGFNTMSTAAHHASGVTLSAGLRGRGGRYQHQRAETSLSGAEYDPDRPIDKIVNGIAGELSMLNVNATPRSRRTGNNGHSVTFDPSVINHSRLHHSHSSTSDSEPHTPDNEPRSRHSANYGNGHYSFDNDNATPKAKPRGTPHFNVEPPTPSISQSTGSKFANLARSLAKDMGGTRGLADVSLNDQPLARSKKTRGTPRRVLHNIGNNAATIPPSYTRRAAQHSASRNEFDHKSQGSRRDDRSHNPIIQLPDVTGLTSAVGSPPRIKMDWRTYSGPSDSDGVEGQLLQTITSLQTRLNQLESENLVSRRRVRELELELEACKMEVKRERTRVLEREEIIVAQQREAQKHRDTTKKTSRPSATSVTEQRYREVVEEKKALEALVGTLRSHLSRLTEELSSQRLLLEELRSLRDADSETIREKMAEVDVLKADVERLGGEIEVLRGVVEEGIRERQRAKESSLSVSPERDEEEVTGVRDCSVHSEQGDTRQTSAETEDMRRERESPKARRKVQDPYNKTMRTDYATVASSELEAGRSNRSNRFVDDDEVEQMMIDVEERKSNRSGSSSGSLNLSQAEAVTERQNAATEAPVDDTSMRRRLAERGKNTSKSSRPMRPAPPRSGRQDTTNAAGPLREDATSTPFPQIRGERLERLFFSAPEHNEETCRVCHRRQRPNMAEDGVDAPSWLPPRKRAKVRLDEQATNPRKEDPLSENLSSNPFSRDRLPPQTVLVRVLRELEDDFTHYKGIYTELADQYKIMDAISNVPKRNALAEHLKDVINTLEQKGDQIASLYDLLTFKDKPIAESVVRDKPSAGLSPRRSSTTRTKPFTGRSGLKKHATFS